MGCVALQYHRLASNARNPIASLVAFYFANASHISSMVATARETIRPGNTDLVSPFNDLLTILDRTITCVLA